MVSRSRCGALKTSCMFSANSYLKMHILNCAERVGTIVGNVSRIVLLAICFCISSFVILRCTIGVFLPANDNDGCWFSYAVGWLSFGFHGPVATFYKYIIMRLYCSHIRFIWYALLKNTPSSFGGNSEHHTHRFAQSTIRSSLLHANTNGHNAVS